MQLRSLLLGLTLVVATSPCRADIPVTDTARETTEKSISDCMTKARVSKQQTLQPSQGVTQSVQTPSAAQVPAAGGDNISAAGVSAPASGVVSGMNLSGIPTTVTAGATSVGGLNLNAVAQTVSALSSTTSALSNNTNNGQSASALIGALLLSQAAWNQNSGLRSNNGAMWNQAIMAANLTAQLINQRGLNSIAGASRAAQTLTYVPTLATFVGLPVLTNSNAVIVPVSTTH